MAARAAFLAAVACLLPAAGMSQESSRLPRPRLVLQITVDQLRGDIPWRHYEEFGEGGFRYLLDHGTVYAQAHHRHANTETIVGHATLATGADPAAHGMVGNVWLDRETGELTYNIEDPRYRLLTAGAGVDRQTEIDPTQAVAGTEGRSPAAIMVSTFSDELAIGHAGRSKIFGVSVKDRGAVSLAGHAGKAFWFSKASGEFVTSTYYYDEYPAWVTEWNEKRLPFEYGGKSWHLLRDASDYLFGDADDRPWETDFPGYGRTFPHPFGAADGRYFTTLLTLSPVGDVLTLDFALTLMEQEGLGQDDVTDYLALSFSSTDYVGHLFGPSSLEEEDNLLRLDQTLAELLAFVDEHVGLDQTLIVLSADHGAPEVPGYLAQFGIAADYIRPDTWDTAPAMEALKRRFGIGQELIETYYHPYVYLNRDAIREHDLDQAEVERAVATELVRFPGVALAVSSAALREGNFPDTELHRAVSYNFNPARSGDVYVVFEPHWFMNEFDGLAVAATHGTPWTYDTHVPVVFAGMDIPPQRLYRRVNTVDVATTLAAYLGVKPPSGSSGVPLVEVLERSGR